MPGSRSPQQERIASSCHGLSPLTTSRWPGIEGVPTTRLWQGGDDRAPATGSAPARVCAESPTTLPRGLVEELNPLPRGRRTLRSNSMYVELLRCAGVPTPPQRVEGPPAPSAHSGTVDMAPPLLGHQSHSGRTPLCGSTFAAELARATANLVAATRPYAMCKVRKVPSCSL